MVEKVTKIKIPKYSHVGSSLHSMLSSSVAAVLSGGFEVYGVLRAVSTDPLDLFVKRCEFLAGYEFLCRRYMT